MIIMEMDKRKIKILQAIIHDYIQTAEPVGSRTIAKKYDLGVSSATIRNEMSDLEDMGYLEQLHSSSGRKPSDKGYRLYVDKLMNIQKLSSMEECAIKTHIINSALYEIEKVVREASAILADLTKLTTVVMSPSSIESYIKSIQLIGLDANTVLLVLVIDTGIIKNNVIKLHAKMTIDELVKINRILNIKLNKIRVESINLDFLKVVLEEFKDYEKWLKDILPVLYETLLSGIDSNEIYLEGATNIFNYPEYNDIQRAKDFLSLIDDKDKVKNLIKSDDNITIKIGKENFIEDAKDCTIITAVYKLKDRPLGTIGVIGPTRMPYSRVVSILSTLVDELDKLLKDDNI
ncbi:heat-inducible transcription repressor HrcA [Clostridium tetani]|nr:heat-inducible transcription repressor HrcA [Clostridium tetani]BDR84556.1 heat-inducible transcription repressor HrcA [Clostridium tetani]